mgnify:CR=1 FL=1|jgi:ABC-2 type transport system ATP-binding protein
MAAEVAVRATGLSKRFGKVQAVSDIDLGVAQGEALGLLGPNGAGKSTTLSMLMGLQAPDAGHAMIFGHAAGSAAARAVCGATPQSTDLPDALPHAKFCPIRRHGMALRQKQVRLLSGLPWRS